MFPVTDNFRSYPNSGHTKVSVTSCFRSYPFPFTVNFWWHSFSRYIPFPVTSPIQSHPNFGYIELPVKEKSSSCTHHPAPSLIGRTASFYPHPLKASHPHPLIQVTWLTSKVVGLYSTPYKLPDNHRWIGLNPSVRLYCYFWYCTVVVQYFSFRIRNRDTQSPQKEKLWFLRAGSLSWSL